MVEPKGTKLAEGPGEDMVAVDEDAAAVDKVSVGKEITGEGSLPIIVEDIKE